MSSSLRIMTYNVRYFSHSTRGVAATARGMRSIAAAIAGLAPLPDVICLQEVETASLRANLAHPRRSGEETQLSRLLGALHEAIDARADASLETGPRRRYSALYFPAHTYTLTPRTNFYTTGLAILVGDGLRVRRHNAHQPIDITHRRVRLLSGWKQTRISAHLVIERSDGTSLDVFNTHLSLPASFTREFLLSRRRMGYGRNQIAEARTLADFIDSERTSDRFLVVGDFNALPGSPVHHFLTHERGYHDAFRGAFPGRSEQRWPTAGFLNLRMHLDHVFSGPGLEWLDFDGSAPFGDRSTRFFGLSDHVPLIGRFAMAPAPATPKGAD